MFMFMVYVFELFVKYIILNWTTIVIVHKKSFNFGIFIAFIGFKKCISHRMFNIIVLILGNKIQYHSYVTSTIFIYNLLSTNLTNVFKLIHLFFMMSYSYFGLFNYIIDFKTFISYKSSFLDLRPKKTHLLIFSLIIVEHILSHTINIHIYYFFQIYNT